MNPIENVWGLIFCRIYCDNKQYANVKELKAAIIGAWETLEGTALKSLIDSIPNRIFELIEKKDGPTHY